MFNLKTLAVIVLTVSMWANIMWALGVCFPKKPHTLRPIPAQHVEHSK